MMTLSKQPHSWPFHVTSFYPWGAWPGMGLLLHILQQLPRTFFRVWEYSVAIVMFLACTCGLRWRERSAEIEVGRTIVVILVFPLSEISQVSPLSWTRGPFAWAVSFSPFLTTLLDPDTQKKETGWLLKPLTMEKVPIFLERKRAEQKHYEGLWSSSLQHKVMSILATYFHLSGNGNESTSCLLQ